MTSHFRATCYIAGCCHQANSISWSRATSHIAEWCHLANSMPWCQSHLSHCRIATSRQIQWHVIPQPRVILQGAATRRIRCHDLSATCHTAGWQIQCHVIPEPRATLQGAATWRIHWHDLRATGHIAGCCYQANLITW